MAQDKSKTGGKSAPRKKLTRKQKKELLRRQLANEKILEERGDIPKRSRYRARGIFWRVFAVCLSFFIGIIAGLGGLIGSLVFVGSGKGGTHDLLTLLGMDEATIQALIKPTYADMSVFDFANSIMDDIGSGNLHSLAAFSKYTPFISDYYSDIDGFLSPFGISLDWEAIETTEFSELGNYFQNTVLPGVALGPILDLDHHNEGDAPLTLEDINGNALLYTVCYGKYGRDYIISSEGENSGKIEMLGDAKPTSIGTFLGGNAISELSGESPEEGSGESGGTTALLESLELGSLLGLDIVLPDEEESVGSLLYSVCYGTKDKDYHVEDGLVVMEEGSEATTIAKISGGSTDFLYDIELNTVIDTEDPVMQAILTVEEDGVTRNTTIGDLVNGAQDIILGVSVETLLSVNANSDPAIRYLAYGPELTKDAEGAYIEETEPVDPEAPDGELQYVGGGRYKIEGQGESAVIHMMPDPNDPTGETLYTKQTVGDLTGEDADLIGGAKISDLVAVDTSSSALMQAIGGWTIEDLQNESTIESLKIGDVIEIDGDSSLVMQALSGYSLAELKQQETINNLKLGDLIQIDDTSAPIMQAMKDWHVSDLTDSTRIERLKLKQIVMGRDSNLMQAIGDWRISDLSDQAKVNSLTLSAVIEIDPADPATPQILVALSDMTLGEISTKADTLTLEDILGEEQFRTEPGSNENRILSALRHCELKDLATSINKLTIEDLFGDEMYSYAKNYVKDTRPAPEDKVENADVTVRCYSGENEVFGGWYKGDAESGYTKVSEELVKKNSYVEEKTALTRTVTYTIVDYAHPDSHIPYEGSPESVLEDDFGFYYLDAENGDVRVDLDDVVTYQITSSSAPLPEGTRVYGDEEMGWYFLQQVPVTYRYAKESGSETYEENAVTQKYYAEETEVTRYYSGVWYLLLGTEDGSTGTATPITEMASLISGVSDKMNTLTLGTMYAHELIQDDPHVELDPILMSSIGHPEWTSLGDLTISDVIELITQVATTK